MRKCTVAQVARLAGITPSAIRQWEARYGWPCPGRDPVTGHRVYSQRDADDIRRMAAMTRQGHDIGTLIRDGQPCFPTRTAAKPQQPSIDFTQVPQPRTWQGIDVRRRLERALIASDHGAIAACIALLPRIHPQDHQGAVLGLLAIAGYRT